MAEKSFSVGEGKPISRKELKEHIEEHGGIAADIPQLILGGQDGLVNVLGIILGVAVATQDVHIVLVAGLAATFAESISMAAVAYTSTRADYAFFLKQREQEKKEIDEIPHVEEAEVMEILENKGYNGKDLQELTRLITSNRKMWVDFMMSEELNLPPKHAKHSIRAAVIVGGSALIGSLIPLIPFLLGISTIPAIYYAVVISLIALFITGAYKARITVGSWYKSGLEIAAIGITAAMAGYIIGVILSSIP